MKHQIYRLEQLKEVVHKEMPCCIPPKKPLTNEIHMEIEQKASVIYHTGMSQQLITSINSYAKMCKSQQASHLAFGACKLSDISKGMYANNSLKLKECPNTLNNQCEHEDCFHMSIKTISLLPKQTSLVFMQSFHSSDKH